jgi:hypothetical protein
MSEDEDVPGREPDSDADRDREGEGFDDLDHLDDLNDFDDSDEFDDFDDFDDPAAETGDPFDELGAGVADGDADAGGDPGTDDLGTDPEPPGRTSDAGRDDPFDDLGFPDADRGGSSDDAAAALEDAFERMDVDGPAEEDVWESLDADVDAAAGFGAAAGLGEATSVPGQGDTEHVVSKRTYCQQCPHFTSPPEVACTHEGTTIVEAVGFDEFRVRNCPMISEEDPTFDTGG